MMTPGSLRFHPLEMLVSPLEHVDALLHESCGPARSGAAWVELVRLLNEHFSESPQGVLAIRATGLLEGLSGQERYSAMQTLARYMRNSLWRHELMHVLGESGSPNGRALGLLLSTPADFAAPSERDLLRSLLRQGRLSARIQARVLGRTIAANGASDRVDDLVDAFLQGGSTGRKRRRLARLKGLLGQSEYLERRLGQLESRVQIACPRCGTRLTRTAMIHHLMTKHALLLHGKKVRGAWRVIDLWLANYKRTHDKRWLRRCFDLVPRLEDPLAVRRLQQHMVLQGVAQNAMLRRLLLGAQASRAALCPNCLSQAPVPQSRLLEPLLQSHGLLSRQGYRVHVRRDGAFPVLRVETPEGLLFEGHEPGKWLTHQGIITLGAFPLAALAVVFAFLGAPTFTVVVSLILASFAYGASWLREWREPSAADHAVDIAWTMLCPHLLARGPTAADAEFMAALALASVGKGSPEQRESWLDQFRQERNDAMAAGAAPSAHLACVVRLAISDAATRDVDLAALTARAIGRCWRSEMPMSFAQQLLDDWRSVLWTRGSMARLRILLFDQAFAEGWEIGDLEHLREETPALAAVLELFEEERAAELRWLWSLRATAPWLKIGPCRTCFELAAQTPPEQALFEKHPDVLFVEPQHDGMVICSSGIYWRIYHFTESPRQVRITERVADERRSYTLHMGGESIPMRHDPSAFVDRLDRWINYLRDDFQANAKQTRKWAPSPGTNFLPAGELAICPECHHHFVGTVGEVGFKVTVRQGE